MMKIKILKERDDENKFLQKEGIYEFFGSIALETLIFEPGHTISVPVGFSLEIPDDYCFIVKEHPEAAVIGLSLKSGIIRSKEPILLILNNTSNLPIYYGYDGGFKNMGYRTVTNFYSLEKPIAQGFLVKKEAFELEEVHSFDVENPADIKDNV